MQAELHASCSLHHVTNKNIDESFQLSFPKLKDAVRVKSLVALSYSDHIILGVSESNSGFYGLRGTARQEMRQMGDCGFDPGRTLVMKKLEGKCATNESLKKLATKSIV